MKGMQCLLVLLARIGSLEPKKSRVNGGTHFGVKGVLTVEEELHRYIGAGVEYIRRAAESCSGLLQVAATVYRYLFT